MTLDEESDKEYRRWAGSTRERAESFRDTGMHFYRQKDWRTALLFFADAYEQLMGAVAYDRVKVDPAVEVLRATLEKDVIALSNQAELFDEDRERNWSIKLILGKDPLGPVAYTHLEEGYVDLANQS